MADVIRLASVHHANAGPGRQSAVFPLLHVYGECVGYRVCLIHDPSAPDGGAYRVVVGQADGDHVREAAIVPATLAGEIDAHVAAIAILRALETVEAGLDDPPV